MMTNFAQVSFKDWFQMFIDLFGLLIHVYFAIVLSK